MNNEQISVVMTTYNGIQRIKPQLDSLLAQTKAPDEVIIADDCSTDGTYEFCCDYINAHNLCNWKIYRNAKNLGVCENFRVALSKAKGEYIFSCDQDDIWLPEKIDVMTSAIKSRPEIKLLVSNYIPIINGKRKNVHLKNNERNDGAIIQIRFEDSFLAALRPGCVFCMRRELLNNFKIVDFKDATHDAMLWKYAVLSNSLYLINRQLIYYVRHQANTTGALRTKPFTVGQKVEMLRGGGDTYEEFIAHAEELGINDDNVRLMRKQIKFIDSRVEILTHRNLFSTILFVITNLKYYPTFRNAISDIYAVMFLKE